MALSDSDINTRVRFLLQDVVSDNYRWSDTELTAWTKDGAREIARIRPEAIVGYQAGSVACSLPSDSTTITEAHGDALVNYVAHRACQKDAENGNPGLANTYFQEFRAGLGLTG